MRDHDYHDFRALVRHAALSWHGSRPRAAQSRWAVELSPARRPRAGRLLGALFAVPVVAGIIFGLMAASHNQNPATQVLRVVSRGFPGPAVAPAPLPSPTASPTPPVVRRPIFTGPEPEPASRPRTFPPPNRWPNE